LVDSLRKPATPDAREAFVRGEDNPEQLAIPNPSPAASVASPELPVRRTQATFRLKEPTHKRLKKVSSLLDRDMLEIAEEGIERYLEELIDQNGLREVVSRLGI
jgi:predicted DNA-binding protein